MFYKGRKTNRTLVIILFAFMASCSVPKIVVQTEQQKIPDRYEQVVDTGSFALQKWRNFFTDSCLMAYIDIALKQNQELNTVLQEIEIARNDVRKRKAALLPFVKFGGGAGVDKLARYTPNGALVSGAEMVPDKKIPDPISDFNVAASANWELDIWHKLRNARQAAFNRYLSTIAGTNFVMTNLIAEVAGTYYELEALDNQLKIVQQNIVLQTNALEIVKAQKQAARTTELAVQKFRAELLHAQSMQFEIKQQIKEAENRMHLLLGQYPIHLERNSVYFMEGDLMHLHVGLPAQLLENRPDIQQAEQMLKAARLDVKVARAEFYPSLGINATLGLRAFTPKYLTRLPESIIGSLAGDLVGPLINRNAIKAEFYTANARQIAALYTYERTIISAYLEVSSALANIDNLHQEYDLRVQQVDALTTSINIAGDLFKSARADYLEVLTTQRDVLDAKLELVNTRRDQMEALVKLYRNLGGGWQ